MISIVVPTVDIGMLNATLPGWIAQATTGAGEVIVINGSEESSEQVVENFGWLIKAHPHWKLIVVDEEAPGGVVASMIQGYKLVSSDTIIFLHDDVFIHSVGWDAYVLSNLYTWKDVGVVGFGGCTELGVDTQTSGKYFSNWDDAEFYGIRCKTYGCDVAHVDGQCLVIRKEILDRELKVAGEMLELHLEYFSVYDVWFSCIARERGYRVRIVGVKSYHVSWLKGDGIRHHRNLMPVDLAMKAPGRIRHHQGQNLSISRKYLSERFKDILPIKVGI